MLNELYDLNTSIAKAGIARQSWHKNYKCCPKNRTFLLLVSSDGSVFDLEPIKDMERVAKIRKYEVSNGVSFPAFNVQPLLHTQIDRAREAVKNLKENIRTKSQERNAQEIASQIDELWAICGHLWSSGEMERIDKCLQSAGLKQKLQDAINILTEDYQAIPQLLERLENLKAGDLQRTLKPIIVKHILRSEDANLWIDALLVSTAKSINAIKKVSIVLELADRSSFHYPVNHETTFAWINEALLADPEASKVQLTADELDAFGKPMKEEDNKETFPAPNLPRLGKVTLRAMSSEIHCQKRYGRIGANSFPAGAMVRQNMKDSLEWLCHENRKRITWADASGACGFTKRDGKKVPVSGLFLVYPSSLGGVPPELAALFFREDEAVDPDGARFEAAAARVISALRIMVVEQPNAEVRVFCLAKADKARTKLLVSTKYDAHGLISGATEWQVGCRNIPLIRLNAGTNDKPVWVEPIVPFPAEVVKCLNVSWFQNGKKADLVHGLTIGEGVAVLLGSVTAVQSIVRKALHLATINASPMLCALGQADHHRAAPLKLDSRYAGHASFLPCVLGLLLFKLNSTKGEYMHKAPFLVGRLLALADTLHKEYCRHVRKNETPPQLIGNALMSAAIDSPVRGLARLRERLMIYQAWANTSHDEGIGLAKWTLSQMGNVSSEIALLDLPDRPTDPDKAQMLLGYLARIGDNMSKTDTIDVDREVSNVGSSE